MMSCLFRLFLLFLPVAALIVGCEKKEAKEDLHFGTSPGDGAAEEEFHFGTSPGDGAAEERIHFGTSPDDGISD